MTFSRSTARVRNAAYIPALLVAAFLAGCATNSDSSEATAETPKSEMPKSETATAREVTTSSPRLVATYEGGLHVIDATTLDVVDTIELDGFTRVNPAGNGRHVIVSTGDEFRVLDTGAWTDEHGDHEHHFVSEPELTDVAFESDHPGHVVHNAGRTALFSDGTGRVEIFRADDLAHGKPPSKALRAEHPHHGVAVPLPRGRILISLGTEEQGIGAKVIDGSGDEIARSENCPGVHGAAVASDDHVVVGCEDGALVYHDGRFRKIASADPYARIGNQAGGTDTPIVLGDYKTDPDATLERPRTVTLINTVRHRIREVELDASYSFRSLARGPNGAAVVLGTDGVLRIIDERTAQVSAKIQVVDAWKEPVDWQRPRPTLYVSHGTAYVTDPRTESLHKVDLERRQVVESTTLPDAPNELTGVTG